MSIAQEIAKGEDEESPPHRQGQVSSPAKVAIPCLIRPIALSLPGYRDSAPILFQNNF